MREDGENPFDGLGCTSINRRDVPFGNRTLHWKAIGNLFERVFEGVRCGPCDFLWTIQTTEWLTDGSLVSRLYHLFSSCMGSSSVRTSRLCASGILKAFSRNACAWASSASAA